MQQNEIIEGNISIDIFMGKSAPYEVGIGSAYADDLKYHTSFDWLMPVVEKISKIHSINGLYRQYEKVSEALLMIDISLLFKAVVSFIKWYNENNKTK